MNTPKVERSVFGKLSDGREVESCTLKNSNGMEMEVLSFGGIVRRLLVPDRNGLLEDVVMGYDDLDSYERNNPYFGAIIGRFGNRIANARFSLEGNEFNLNANNGPNCLHGADGFHQVIWGMEPYTNETEVGVILTYTSPSGEMGFPGNLNVRVTYSLDDGDNFKVDYHATTDAITVINLTHHSYFNLSACKEDILNHDLVINADRFLPVNEHLVPTGQLQAVEGTPFDFRRTKLVGEDISLNHEQLKLGNGYDHNWVLNRESSDLDLAATLGHKASGRNMDIYTTEPGIQFFSGNLPDGAFIGKGLFPYPGRYGICLETQHFPNSPNQPEFPSSVLRPGEVYSSRTVHKFYTAD
jgi:aldose 1-epimerase